MNIAISGGAPGMGSDRSCVMRPRHEKTPMAAEPIVCWNSLDFDSGKPLIEYSMLCAQCTRVCAQPQVALETSSFA